MNIAKIFIIVVLLASLFLILMKKGYLKAVFKKIKRKLSEFKMVFQDQTRIINNSILEKYNFSKEYSSLTATDSADNADNYVDLLSATIKQRAISNIAVTGPYGAGKTSIINTFLKSHPLLNRKTARISLATFNDPNFKKIESPVLVPGETPPVEPMHTGIEVDQILEKGILHQLLYSSKPNDLPSSRYKRLYKKSWIKIFSFLLLVIFIIVLWKPNLITIFKQNTNDIFLMLPTFLTNALPSNNIIFISIFLGLLALFFVSIFISNISIGNAKIKMENLELSQNNGNEGIFDKNLDELIYFFEVQKINLVVIEDLDRFDNIKIFESLRELNTIINQSPQIKQKVTFLYAIRDDIFKNVDRTKFFDFIIPIIPIVNYTNSFKYLEARLLDKKESETNSTEENTATIKKDFLRKLSIFLDDKRLIDNICNEFNIYKANLGETGLDQNKLLSIIVIKNIYPNEFSKLVYGTGRLYDLFNINKKGFLNGLLKDIESDLTVIKSENIDIENAKYKNYKHLKAQLWSAIQHYPDAIHTLYQFSTDNSGEPFAWNTFYDDVVDISHWSNNTIITKRQNQFLNITLLEIGRNWDMDFEKEIANIDKIHNNILEKNQAEIKKLNEKTQAISRLSVKDLVDNHAYCASVFKNGKDDQLIKLLILEDKFSEDYHKYTTYFHPGKLSNNDEQFIRSAISRNNLKYDFKLDNFDNILEEIIEYSLPVSSALNYSFLEYLLSNQDVFNRDKSIDVVLREIYTSIGTNGINYEFVTGFIAFNPKNKSFYNLLLKYIPNYFEYGASTVLLETSKYGGREFYTQLKYALYYAETETINASNDWESRKNTDIEDFENFLIDIPPHIDITIFSDKLKQLDIKFSAIEGSLYKNELVGEIIEKGMYHLNIDIVTFIMKNYLDANVDDITEKNYTTILEIEEKNDNKIAKIFVSKIHSNLAQYTREIFLKLQNNTKEDVSAIITLLNAENFQDIENNIPIKENILTKQEHIFSSFNNIPDTLWTYMVMNKKIIASWNNFYDYYQTYGLKTALEFIGEYIDELPADKIGIDEYNDMLALFEEIQSSAIINNGTLEKIVNRIEPSILDFSENILQSTNKEHLSIWIASKAFRVTEDNYNRLYNAFPDLAIPYVLTDIKSFAEFYTNVTFAADLLIKVLTTSKQNKPFKEEIVTHYFEKYGYQGGLEDVKTILEYSSNNSLEIEMNDATSNAIFNDFANSNQANNPTPDVVAILLLLPTLSEQDVLELIEKLGEPYSNILTSKKTVKWEGSAGNRILATQLYKKGIIEKHTQTKGGINVKYKTSSKEQDF